MEAIEAFPLVKVLKYLTILKKDFETTEGKIIVTEKIDDQEYRIVTIYIEPWIRMMVELGNLEDFPEDKRCEVMRKLLEMNHNYAEVAFSVAEDGTIISLQDILRSALSMDVFEEEYGAIPFAIKLYQKEIEKLKK